MRPAQATLLAVCALAGCARDDPFLREVADVPRPRGQDRVEITHVVQRHILAGASTDDAVKFAEQRGFKVYPGPQVPLGYKSLIATKQDRYYLIFSEETRLILEIEGSQVMRARGWVFLKGI